MLLSGESRVKKNTFVDVYPSPSDGTMALLLALRRKLAVCASIGGWLGIGRWPSAIPTMAVMWVSVPKTWIGMPVVFPGRNKTKQTGRLVTINANGIWLSNLGRLPLTHFSHHPQALLVVGPATSHKDGDLVFLQGALVVFDSPDNALRERMDGLGEGGGHTDRSALCFSHTHKKH